ncbi:MAG: NfeD family protein [Sandaracinaceae bacterium]|nr:NfeD family protein [Sandaracinaceae bacterium]
MLTYLYLFSVIVGGVLLAASILLGGKDLDADGDADADLDADLDADADADLDADLDADADADVEADAHGSLGKDVGGHGDVAGFLYLFLSLRFWIFFLAFFGLTGIVLDVFGLVSSELLGLGLAIGMGLAVGGGTTGLIKKLTKDSAGAVVTSKDYVGKTARVLVPFEGASVGKVRVEIGGRSVDLLASGVEDEDEPGYGGKEEVLIVEMDGSRARVARLESKKASR